MADVLSLSRDTERPLDVPYIPPVANLTTTGGTCPATRVDWQRKATDDRYKMRMRVQTGTANTGLAIAIQSVYPYGQCRIYVAVNAPPSIDPQQTGSPQ